MRDRGHGLGRVSSCARGAGTCRQSLEPAAKVPCATDTASSPGPKLLQVWQGWCLPGADECRDVEELGVWIRERKG